ncbi:YsnF/AvaK domain-containing protein [Bacillus marasmi]|uniref:YsnF/AvaK domain-containing protein n=1 Tax=Bacillus marasmi TaxID=1926279 RepID=UPI0011CB675A|nr:YsnF/AvaK domain-containing protein [Bacillus marasmi]
MADFFGLFGDDKSQNNDNANTQMNDTASNTQSSQNDGKLELHKEELDITKNTVNAGEVVLSKEIVEEQKTVEVPVMHEEVVITRRPVNDQSSTAAISSDESIHIPVSQEQVDAHKHTVTTEEISASKRQVSETQQIEETLRREEAKVDTTGGVDIVSDGTDPSNINS